MLTQYNLCMIYNANAVSCEYVKYVNLSNVSDSSINIYVVIVAECNGIVDDDIRCCLGSQVTEL